MAFDEIGRDGRPPRGRRTLAEPLEEQRLEIVVVDLVRAALVEGVEDLRGVLRKSDVLAEGHKFEHVQRAALLLVVAPKDGLQGLRTILSRGVLEGPDEEFADREAAAAVRIRRLEPLPNANLTV